MMMMSFLRLCSLSLLSLSSAFAWIGNHQSIRSRPSTQLFGVETISLLSLVNHEEDGTLMAESIAKWLDSEWMEQEVHVQMGESAKQSYIACREAGNDDITDVMMAVSDDLLSNWKQYDKDAFVNPYDIGNYVADYLTKRSGNEGCASSSDIF